MEGEKVEYKKSLATMGEILETITAFANTAGGEVYIGVDDGGNVVGVTIGKNTLENLAKDVNEGIEPKVNLSIKTSEAEGKTIIVITVASSNQKPHFFKGIAYKRTGRSNLKLSPPELEELFIKRALSLHDIDNLKFNIGITDLSEELLRTYVREISKKYHNMTDSLKTLGLMNNEDLTPSAVLFFGINPEKFFPLYGIKCAVFRGLEMLAIKDYRAPIYANIVPVLDFIKQNIPSKIRFEGVKRYEESVVPGVALREALLNAAIHADYTLDPTIYVKITENYIEIKNGGTLPAPLTIKELEKPHISKPRNKRIAALCHALGWIEHWGEGTLKITTEMRKHGLDVEFEEKNGYFSVRLYTKEIKLNKGQEKILEVLKRRERIVSGELKKLGIPDRTIRAHLAFLAEKGFIKKFGKGRKVFYTIDSGK
ncbi:putative DNA binding domain-containing protein [Candidatus Micrarchaeota archaeon]|nr:putative DNA binding domain-containing protein [Candidatus Micrarchaeota archaeon]